MVSVLGVEEIATCRSGPDNDIDLKAVYGGRILGRRQTSLKVNPVFTDHQATFNAEDDQNISLHVTMYETFPRTKDRQLSNPVTQGEKMVHNGQLTNGHLRVANGVHGVYSGKEVYIDEENQLMDVNRNTLTQSKTFDSFLRISQEVHEDIPVYAKVTKKRNLPELLGPLNNEKIQVDVTAEIDDKEGESKNENINDQNKSKFDEKQKYQKSGSSDSLVRKNEDSHEDGLKDVHCYENKGLVNDEGKNNSHGSNLAAESSVLTRTDSFTLLSQSKNILPNSQFSSSPLIPHDYQINSEDESEGKEVVSTEILTEVIVHKVDEPSINCSDLKRCSHKLCRQENLCDSLDEMEDDWPDLDTLVRSDNDAIVEVDNQTHDVPYPRVRSVSDVVDPDYATIESVNEIGENEDLKAKEGTYKKNTKSSKVSSKGSTINEGSTRTLKSILTSSSNISHLSESQNGEHKRSVSESEIHEVKSVKFSQDTVFNENKSNKYKQEKINLRDIYCGKISSDAAMAKLNPLFMDDEGKTGSLTDDEKLAYQLTLKNAMKLSKGKAGSLNQPSYLEQYLILKAHGLKAGDGIERLPEWMDKPDYHRLIQRTLAKERRKCVCKWTLVILTVFAITAVATVLGIHFTEGL
ncbi:hypothetical protein DPMN_113967 [Dreissena polymorpha]|uniref:Uncharacterized protein n=1 Tax=Dreissena polymorpha TaxID=45954 RepID=A0A9D4KID1_DREPO|nr:hypothetical protein DPMN_113967 [Dreissena polymorpha]